MWVVQQNPWSCISQSWHRTCVPSHERTLVLHCHVQKIVSRSLSREQQLLTMIVSACLRQKGIITTKYFNGKKSLWTLIDMFSVLWDKSCSFLLRDYKAHLKQSIHCEMPYMLPSWLRGYKPTLAFRLQYGNQMCRETCSMNKLGRSISS